MRRLSALVFLVSISLSQTSWAQDAIPNEPVICGDRLALMDVAFSRFTNWLSTSRDGVVIDYSVPSQGIGHALIERSYYERLLGANEHVVVAQTYTFTAQTAASLRNILAAKSEESVPYVIRAVPGAAASAATPLLGAALGVVLDQLASISSLTQVKASFLAGRVAEGGRLLLVHVLKQEPGGRLWLQEIIVYNVQVGSEETFAYLASCRYVVALGQNLP